MSPSGSPPAVGKILAERRTQKGLSLQNLSKISGVSKSMISQIENGQVNPTLAVVWKLANGLGIKLQELLEGELEAAETDFMLLTEANCPTLASRDHGYKTQILSTIDMVEKVELYLVEFEANGAMVSAGHEEGTYETLTVIRGEMEVELPGQKIKRLKALESCRYRADGAHTLRARGKHALIYLAVNFDLNLLREEGPDSPE